MPFDNAPLHNVFLAVRQILPSSSYAAFMRAVHMAASMVALVGMFCAVPLAAQLAKPEKSRILSIDVEGNSTIDKSAIINLSGLLIGDEIIVTPGLPNAKLADAIKNLWKRKQFKDVNILIDRITPAGVYLKIKVEEASHVAAIRINGNQAQSSKEIIKATDKHPGDLISDYDLNLIEKAVKNLYEKDGKQFAKVSATLAPTDTSGYYDLVLNIKESVAFYVNSITFSGNKNFTDKELAGAFENTQTKEWWQFWKSTKFDRKKYDKDKDALANFYKKNGFVNAYIVRDSLSYNDVLETVDIHIQVEEGQRLYVRNITFEGNLVYPSEFLLYRLGFSTGDVYNAEKFAQNLFGNQEQSDIAAMYMNNGYLAMRPEPEERPVPGTDSVDINIKIYERNQYTIRRVEIEGNTKTKDKVIRRELFTRPGDYFNRAAIIRGVRFLGQLNYFNPEKLKPDVKPVDNTQVDVIYKVEERSADTFNASVGYAGFFGVTGTIGLTFNNFSLAEPLAGGGGQVVNFNWEFGGRGTQFTPGLGLATGVNNLNIGITEPWLFDEPTTAGFNFYRTEYRNNFQAISVGGDLQVMGGAVNIGRRFRFPDDFFRGDWQMQIRNVTQLGGVPNIFFPEGLEVSLRQTISRVSIDNAIFPTDGSRFSWATTFAAGALGLGRFDYIKSALDFDVFTPLLQIGENNRLVLRIASNFGYVTGLRDNDNIPPLERYVMGGTVLGGFALTPLRGYPNRSIGPRTISGADLRRAPKDEFGNEQGSNPIGGLVQLTNSVEVRFAVTLNPVPIYLIGFAEAGNVWDNLSSVNPFDLKRSAGVGVRLLLNPIGLIGFDYGYGFDRVAPIDGDNGLPQFRFQIQFGR